MAKVCNGLLKLRKGTFNSSSFRLWFHINSRSIHTTTNENNFPDIRSDWEKIHNVGINCQIEFEKVYNLNVVPKFTNIDAGFNLFDGVIHTRPLPSVDNFNRLLDAVTNLKHYSYTIHLFKQMCDIGDEYSMSIAIKCYCHLNNTHHGFTVLGFFLKRGIRPNVEIYNALLDGFILEDKTHEAERLFKNIVFQLEDVCEPNVVTYNTMIKGLCKVGNYFTAIGLMRLMDVRGCNPDLVTYNTIIHGLCNDLLIDDAFMLFKHKAIHPNVVTYNSLIYALCKLDRWDDVSSFLKQMQDENISPDVPTFTILLDAFAKKGNMNDAELVFDLLSRSGKYPDIRTYNSLIHGYCLRGEMNKAKSIFDSMGVNPNIDTYNSLLNGYVRLFELDEATHMYSKLIDKEVEIKPATYFIMTEVWNRYEINNDSHWHRCIDQIYYTPRLVHVCKTFQIDEALSLFRYGDASNYHSYGCEQSLVIDCARKCGKLDIARRFFHDIHVKRLNHGRFIYEVIVSSLCEQGLLKEAKRMVYKMEKTTRRFRWEVSADMITNLLNGYMKFKPPFDELYKFLELFEQRIDHMRKSYEKIYRFECYRRDTK